MRGHRAGALLLSSAVTVALAQACYDRGDRWLPGSESEQPQVLSCELGSQRCFAGRLESCVDGLNGPGWELREDCAAQGLVCAPTLLSCTSCVPNTLSCDGRDVVRCAADGGSQSFVQSCDDSRGDACRGQTCVNLCGEATKLRSNVGCEYWAVDLDNARIDDSLNAAAQQFAVVVSNPQPDLTAELIIERDDTRPTEPGAPISVATASIPPLSLRVFKLGPREVDGSPPGQFNTGSHSALTRSAYRITSDVPVVAYQFNPLENVNVFSNDASLLKPVEALTYSPGQLGAAYVALGWPQTIASTEDPSTNFNPRNPIDLRSFLTIVGTRDNTTVRITTSTGVIGGGVVPTLAAGDTYEVQIGPYDVINLETDDFNADFSGSLIEADQPVVAFSGGEASDAPFFETLSDRRCCADHLEEQLDPIRTAGRRFVAPVSESRTQAVAAAGANVAVVDPLEYFRVIAVTEAGADIVTTLGGALAEITLTGRGDYADIETNRSFILESDQPVMLGNVSPSQNAAGIPRGLPGGDPSFLVVPPIEQYRPNYVFLTPDKYSFDFVRIVAPTAATVLLDGQDVAMIPGCSAVAADGLTPDERGSDIPELLVHRCQLSFPIIDPELSQGALAPGFQNDGVHRVDSDQEVGLLVDGFDSFVSYSYAGGTKLEEQPIF